MYSHCTNGCRHDKLFRLFRVWQVLAGCNSCSICLYNGCRLDPLKRQIPVVLTNVTGDRHVLSVSAVVLSIAVVHTISKVCFSSLAPQVVHPDHAFARSILMSQRSPGTSVQNNIIQSSILLYYKFTLHTNQAKAIDTL